LLVAVLCGRTAPRACWNNDGQPDKVPSAGKILSGKKIGEVTAATPLRVTMAAAQPKL
jgi:hypothetical protein